MSNTLRDIYKKENKLQYYFDDTVPRDLFRGQKLSDAHKQAPIIYPHPGYTRSNGPDRLPDVKIVDRNGMKFVLGCRCTQGPYRGISTFDRVNPVLKDFVWYRLPEGTAIPPALAVTQDSDLPGKSNHYTIAPKDDMPLEHFQMLLNTLAKNLLKI